MGRDIRIRYGNLLERRNPAAGVIAMSSPVQRCIDSTKSLLTGLTPDSRISVAVEEMLAPNGRPCPAYDSMMDHIFGSETFLSFMKQHSSLVQAMKFDQSNLSATEQFYVIDGLCDAMLVLEQTGKAIPEMVSMHLMHKCAHTDICVTTSSKQAQAVNTSPLLHFIEQTFLRITSNANVTERVMVMGTHDTMIAFLLQSLNAFDQSTTPSYGSSIIMELHENTEKSNDFFVKIFFRNNDQKLPGSLITPASCDGMKLCPWDQFVAGHHPIDTSEMERMCATPAWQRDDTGFYSCFH